MLTGTVASPRNQSLAKCLEGLAANPLQALFACLTASSSSYPAIQHLLADSRTAHYDVIVLRRRSVTYPAIKPIRVVDWSPPCLDRKGLRRAIAEKWAEEDPHTNYRYNVDRCESGNKVYLLRPTWLNKGFDFQVNIEGLVKVVKPARGATREMPSHADVVHDLQCKVAKYPQRSRALFEAIGAVYDCVDPPAILRDAPALSGMAEGWPVDQSLYAVKWLFIEQDVTYWLQTGRDMLMGAIERNVFSVQ